MSPTQWIPGVLVLITALCGALLGDLPAEKGHPESRIGRSGGFGHSSPAPDRPVEGADGGSAPSGRGAVLGGERAPRAGSRLRSGPAECPGPQPAQGAGNRVHRRRRLAGTTSPAARSVLGGRPGAVFRDSGPAVDAGTETSRQRP